MTQDELASLSFAELRDRLKARIDQVGYVDRHLTGRTHCAI